MLINFRGGPNTYPWISYYQVIRGEVPSTVFADKIVLIGPTSEILHDQFPTAFARGGDMPGVEVHANALETLIRGNPIREVPRGVSTALAMATALIGAVLVVRLHAFRALVAAVGVWAVLVVAAEQGVECEQAGQQYRDVHHARGDPPQLLRLGSEHEREQRDHDQREQDRIGRIAAPAPDQGQVAPHQRRARSERRTRPHRANPMLPAPGGPSFPIPDSPFPIPGFKGMRRGVPEV